MEIDPKWIVAVAGFVIVLHRTLISSLKTRSRELAADNTRLRKESTERVEQLLACQEARREEGREVGQLLARLVEQLRGGQK